MVGLLGRVLIEGQTISNEMGVTMRMDAQEIDRLTPFYRNELETKLSVQERKLMAAICREVEDGDIVVAKVAESSRIIQLNHVHTVLGRLVAKGFLVKVQRSTYAIPDKKLVAHLLVRCCGHKLQ